MIQRLFVCCICK